MVLHKTSTHNTGFSVIEVITVVSLIAIIAGSALVINMDSFRGNNFLNVRDTLVSSLQHARAESINNICVGTVSVPCTEGKPHGVHIEKDINGFVISYVIFQGTIYSSSDPINVAVDVSKNISKGVSVTGATDVYFEQLSGNTAPTSITVSDGLKSSIVNLASEGQIFWTN